jgi:predicted nucleotidyltransferase
MEILPHAEELEVGKHLKLKVCTLEGLVLLKIIANDDNPSRTKDITDIEHIISVYFDLCMEDIFSSHADAANHYDTGVPNYMGLVSARIIGRKINTLLEGSTDLWQRVLTIIEGKSSTDHWAAMADGMKDGF